MKRLITISLLCFTIISLFGCAGKNTTPPKPVYNKETKHMEYPPTDKHMAYYRALSIQAAQPRDFPTRTIEGVEFIKMKGDNIRIQTRSEYTDESVASSAIEAPKNWYSETMDALKVSFPYVTKAFIWWRGFEAFEHNQNKVAKDPVVVKQQNTTTNTSTSVSDTMVSSHDVEVVTQQELVVVDKPFVVETTTTNFNGPTNNGEIQVGPNVINPPLP